MSKSKSPVTITKIRKVLSRCRFDPRAGGPLKIIVDMHGENPRYLEDRAIEMIREAQMAINIDNNVYSLKMDHAITLLAMAQCINEQMSHIKSSKA